MASEGHSEAPKELPLPGYGAWSPNELQAKLAEIGAPTQGEGGRGGLGYRSWKGRGLSQLLGPAWSEVGPLVVQ